MSKSPRGSVWKGRAVATLLDLPALLIVALSCLAPTAHALSEQLAGAIARFRIEGHAAR